MVKSVVMLFVGAEARLVAMGSFGARDVMGMMNALNAAAAAGAVIAAAACSSSSGGGGAHQRASSFCFTTQSQL